MFWKRKSQVERWQEKETPLDKVISDAQLKVIKYREELKMATKQLIVAQGVINFYPEGPIKEGAITEEALFREQFAHILSEYNKSLREYREVLGMEGERVITKGYINNYYPGSVVVRKAYEDFFAGSP